MKWTDIEEIVLQLQEGDPQLDPLSVPMASLQDRVMALEAFDDDISQGSVKVLEAIQMAWSEEFQGD